MCRIFLSFVRRDISRTARPNNVIVNIVALLEGKVSLISPDAKFPFTVLVGKTPCKALFHLLLRQLWSTHTMIWFELCSEQFSRNERVANLDFEFGKEFALHDARGAAPLILSFVN